MMDYDEFIAKAKAVKAMDSPKELGRQLRSLYAADDKNSGTLLQVVRIILEQREDMKEALAKQYLTTEEGIRIALGTQGQISGIDTVLGSIHTLMLAAEDEEDNEQENENGG